MEQFIRELKDVDPEGIDIIVPDGTFVNVYISENIPYIIWTHIKYKGQNVHLSAIGISRLIKFYNSNTQLPFMDLLFSEFLRLVQEIKFYVPGIKYDLVLEGLQINKSWLETFTSVLPLKLIDKLEIDSSILIPINELDFFYDYFTNDFPLFKPVADKVIGRKFDSFMSNMSKDFDIFKSWQYNGVFAYVTVINESKREEVINALRRIIKTAFPTIADDKINNQLIHSSPGTYSGKVKLGTQEIYASHTDVISFRNINLIYNGLWKQYVLNPLIRTRMAECVPVPPELSNLISEYAELSTSNRNVIPESRIYERRILEPKRVRQTMELVLNSQLPVRDLRNIIDDYLYKSLQF